MTRFHQRVSCDLNQSVILKKRNCVVEWDEFLRLTCIQMPYAVIRLSTRQQHQARLPDRWQTGEESPHDDQVAGRELRSLAQLKLAAYPVLSEHSFNRLTPLCSPVLEDLGRLFCMSRLIADDVIQADNESFVSQLFGLL